MRICPRVIREVSPGQRKESWGADGGAASLLMPIRAIVVSANGRHNSDRFLRSLGLLKHQIASALAASSTVAKKTGEEPDGGGSTCATDGCGLLSSDCSASLSWRPRSCLCVGERLRSCCRKGVRLGRSVSGRAGSLVCMRWSADERLKGGGAGGQELRIVRTKIG